MGARSSPGQWVRAVCSGLLRQSSKRRRVICKGDQLNRDTVPPSPSSSTASQSSTATEPTAVDRDRLLIALCTYNEAQNIGEMLDRLRQAMPGADLLVVDDASPDKTSTRAKQWAQENGRCEVVVRENERGLGGAIRRAIEYAIDGKYQLFCNLDADLSHRPEQLETLVRCLIEDRSMDVAIGSRYVDGGSIVGWPWRRRLMSRMVNQFARWTLRIPVRDCSGSMRCYRVSSLANLDLKQLRNNGYALLEELLVRLDRAGAKMTEFPICFTERQAGESKLTIREAATSALAIANLRKI